MYARRDIPMHSRRRASILPQCHACALELPWQRALDRPGPEQARARRAVLGRPRGHGCYPLVWGGAHPSSRHDAGGNRALIIVSSTERIHDFCVGSSECTFLLCAKHGGRWESGNTTSGRRPGGAVQSDFCAVFPRDSPERKPCGAPSVPALPPRHLSGRPGTINKLCALSRCCVRAMTMTPSGRLIFLSFHRGNKGAYYLQPRP